MDLLKRYVELSQPAIKKVLIAPRIPKPTRKADPILQQVTRMQDFTTDEPIKVKLAFLADEGLEREVFMKLPSILDLLECYPSMDLPFNDFISMLPPMRVRYYSISSSPLANSSVCTITFSVIEGDSSASQNPFIGVAGSYLKSLKAGDSLQVAVRPTNKAFRLPLQGDRISVIMFCAGTGLAPFRGFVQPHAIQMQASPHSTLAPALLFVGCRSSLKDRLYATELDEWG